MKPVLKEKYRNDECKKIKNYYLKINIFDPTKNSPNVFLSKLEYRMARYYNVLYDSRKFNIQK